MPGDEAKERGSGGGQTDRAVAGSHPVKCAAGHDAVALVWSDGRVEVACPICGRHDLSDRAAAREAGPPAMEGRTRPLGGAGTPAAEEGLAGDLEDTRPLPVLDEVAAAAEVAACAPGAAAGSEETHRKAAAVSRLAVWLSILAFVAGVGIIGVMVGIRIHDERMAYRAYLDRIQGAAPPGIVNAASNESPPPDTTPPEVTVYSPQDGQMISSPTLVVTGWTEPGAEVKAEVLGNEYPLDNTNGEFSGEIPLPNEPVELVRLTATDQAGNTTEKVIHLRDPVSEIPATYYQVASPYGRYENTLADLRSFLEAFYLPRRYERNVFDCSDSSAMLEWALTISGFEASIVVGPCPWDSTQGSHAWVMVHCSDCIAAVEATALTKRGWLERLFSWSTPGLIYSDNAYATNYYGGYTAEYPDIYAAVRASGSVEEWEWWAGAWGFK